MQPLLGWVELGVSIFSKRTQNGAAVFLLVSLVETAANGTLCSVTGQRLGTAGWGWRARIPPGSPGPVLRGGAVWGLGFLGEGCSFSLGSFGLFSRLCAFSRGSARLRSGFLFCAVCALRRGPCFPRFCAGCAARPWRLGLGLGGWHGVRRVPFFGSRS